MHFRPPLDLSGIPWASNTSTMAASSGNFTVSFGPPDHPVLAQSGQVFCSTCTELLPNPVIINDVNGYYRALGFVWPFRGITKRKWREAYQRKNGQQSEWLTYAFKQLLDRKRRRIYDSLPLGMFILDYYAQQRLNRKAAQEAGRRNAAPSMWDEDIATAGDVLKDWGINPDEEEEQTPPGAGDEPPGDTDQVDETWSWGYYAWRSSCRDDSRLADWQSMIVQAARDREQMFRFAVGFHGRDSSPSMVTRTASGDLVFYLHEDHSPTAGLADFTVANAPR